MKRVLSLMLIVAFFFAVSSAVAEEIASNDCEHLNTVADWGYNKKIYMLGQIGTIYCSDCGADIAKVSVTTLNNLDIAAFSKPFSNIISIILILLGIYVAGISLTIWIEARERKRGKKRYIEKEL